MAKKATTATSSKKAVKKRTSTGSKQTKEGQVLGAVSVVVQIEVWSGSSVGFFDEAVIEWRCLGLSEEPDEVTEISGNRSVDPDRPMTTSEEGLHVFFKPAHEGGTFGLQLACKYNDAVECRTADPKKVEELERKRDEYLEEAHEPSA